MLRSLPSFQMKENANYVVKMATVSKLKGSIAGRMINKSQRKKNTLVCARGEPRKEEREGGRKEGK